MPERVVGVAEEGREVLHRGVEAVPVENLGQGDVDVEVVLVEGVADALGIPGRNRLLGHEALEILELGGRAVGDADHLAGPASPDLVLEDRQVDADGDGLGRAHCRHPSCRSIASSAVRNRCW